MNIFLLSMTIVVGHHLIISAYRFPQNTRVQLIERHIGAYSDQANSRLATIFLRMHRFLAGDFLNPWGTDECVMRALRQSQDKRTLMQFRRSQLLCLLSLQVAIVSWSILRNLLHRDISIGLLLLLLVIAIPTSGWVLYNLQQNKVVKIQQEIDNQLSAILDLLAFSVSAGEPIILAVERVANLCQGSMAQVLSEIPKRLSAGATLTESLKAASDQTSSVAFSRSIRAVQTALDRGTPIAGVLRAQAGQVRSSNRQQLLELAGKKEAAMMVPVVFFILPMIVFIALYPGLSALQLN